MTLTDEERVGLRELISRGKGSARKLTHARILLKADASLGGPGWDDAAISEGLEVGRATVERVRKECVEEGLEAALERRKPRRTYLRVLDGEAEAHLIALTEQTMVHPAKGQRRVRLQDGRHVGRVQANV